MSTPPNILDKYRSHSFHHILIAANNTEAIRKFINPSNAGSSNFLSSIVNKQLGEELTPGSGAYLITDTRRISHFGIQNLNFTMLNGGSASPAESTVIAGSLRMKIIDPSGIGFFNYMKYLIDKKFETDISGVVFLLHTLFIGHTHEGTTEQVDSVSIPMIMSSEFNLTEFGTTGGTYDIGFFPITVGLGQSVDIFCKLNEAFSYTAKESLLGNAIQAFENQLNVKSRDWYLKLNPIFKPVDASVKTSQVKSADASADKKQGRIVQYMITIPENWFYFTVASSSDKNIETDWTKQGKNVSGSNSKEEKISAKLSTASGSVSVQDALMDLFKACPAVNALSSEDLKKQGKSKIYKILTSITSDDEAVLVHFDVVEFVIPDPNSAQKIIDNSAASNKSGLPSRDDNPPGAYVFDYIFSGKNEDIVHLDIHVNNLALALNSGGMYGWAAKDGIVGNPQTLPNDKLETADKTAIYNVRNKQPITIPPRTGAEKANFSTISAREDVDHKQHMKDIQDFHKTLADLSITSLQPQLRIRGNPDLMKQFAVDSIAPHVKMTGSLKEFLQNTSEAKINELSAWEYDSNNSSTAPKAKGGASIVSAHIEHRKYINDIVVNPTQSQLNDAMKSGKAKGFLSQGQFVKINIYGPNDYPLSFEVGGAYKSQLFYDSWYMLFGVSNNFDGTEFTQELNLKAFDLYGEALINKDQSAAK